MQFHQIKRKTKNAKPKRVGRGGKRGKTSGRGHKGQNARAGRKKRPEIRDEIKKLPKLRGRGVNMLRTRKTKPEVVNLSTIENVFSAGDEISPKSLVEKRVIRSIKGRLPRVKILGTGEISKKVTISWCEVSKVAADKVKNAGGDILGKEVTEKAPVKKKETEAKS